MSSPSSELPARLYRRFYVLAALPPVLALLGGLAYRKFVVHAIATNIVINIIILGTAALGVVLMLRTIAGIVREWRGFALLAAGPLGEDGRKAIAPLLGVRLLGHLDEMRDGHLSLLDQSHLHEEMNELREGLNGRQELGQYLVGLMVALGLLGTFIGLLETLVGVGELIGSFGGNSGNLDDSFRALLANLQRPLAAMGTAFAASMFGLIGSLLLGLVQIVVRSPQAAFLDNAHDVANRLAQVSEAPSTVDAQASPAGEAWLAAIVDSMLAAQRDLVDHVALLREEAQHNERRVAVLAEAQRGVIDLTTTLSRATTQHAQITEGLRDLPGALSSIGASLERAAQRADEDERRFATWQRDLDRCHATGLRFLTRMARRNARDVAGAVDRLALAQCAVGDGLADAGRRTERRDRDRDATADELVRLLGVIEHRLQAGDDHLSRIAVETQSVRQTVLQALSAVREAAPDAAVPEPDIIPGVDRLLARIAMLESKLERDLRTAVEALAAPREAA